MKLDRLIFPIVIILALFLSVSIMKQKRDKANELYKLKSQIEYCRFTIDYFEAHYMRRVGVNEFEPYNIISIDFGERWLVVTKQERRVLGYLDEVYPKASASEFIKEIK